MEILLSTVGIVLLITILLFLLKKDLNARNPQQQRDTIPGPKGWPIVGNAFQIDTHNLVKVYTTWATQYGDIFKLKVFKDEIVVFNDYESIQEVLLSTECANRPHLVRVHEFLMKGCPDVAWQSYSPEWLDKKKFVTKCLKVHQSASSSKLEGIVLPQLLELLKDISQRSDQFTQTFDIIDSLHRCVIGIFTSLIYGKKLSENENKELFELDRGVFEFFSPAGLVSLLDLSPWMKLLLLKGMQGPLQAVAKYRKFLLHLHSTMQDKANDCKQEKVGDTCLFNECLQYTNKVTKEKLTLNGLLGIMENVVLGGFSTSTAIMYWMIVIMINYPTTQERLYKEFKEVIGDRKPQMSDRRLMPFWMAFIEETLRYSSISAVGFFHFNNSDVHIRGHHIAKGTMLVTNLWKMHHDERYFEDPLKFKPERFLMVDGDLKPRKDDVWKHVKVFGGGIRICPAEDMARARIFLIMANLVNAFRFSAEDERNMPSCDARDYEGCIVLLPRRFHVKVTKR